MVAGAKGIDEKQEANKETNDRASSTETLPLVVSVDHLRLFLSQNAYPFLLLMAMLFLIGLSLIYFRSGIAFLIVVVSGLLFIAVMLIYFGTSYLLISKVRTEFHDTYLLTIRPSLFRQGRLTKVQYADVIDIGRWSTFADRLLGLESIVLYIKGLQYQKVSFIPFANPYSISGVPAGEVDRWIFELVRRCKIGGGVK
jgi:hypothetical protein